MNATPFPDALAVGAAISLFRCAKVENKKTRFSAPDHPGLKCPPSPELSAIPLISGTDGRPAHSTAQVVGPTLHVAQPGPRERAP